MGAVVHNKLVGGLNWEAPPPLFMGVGAIMYPYLS
jgi:hypothetical protein